MSLTDSVVAALGKIIFIPTRESVPPLPEMSLLFLKENERGEVFPWRAACIDLEMDACGDSMNGAWESLKTSLTMYIEMEKEAADGSIIEAAKIITKAAYHESDQKKEYFSCYRKAKMEYLIRNIESDAASVPIMDKQQLVKVEVEQEPIPSNFGELNEGVVKKVSAIYLFSEQKEVSPKQFSTEESRKNIIWFPLVSPPQGRIRVSPPSLNNIWSFSEKDDSQLSQVLEN